MKEWIVSETGYDSDIINSKLKFAFWEGHRDFAYDFLNFINPQNIVELGSQYGCSLFAFCQSIKDFNLNTSISAVDMWSGDIGAEHSGEQVFEIVKETHSKYYNTVNLQMLQMDFDQALPLFDDESIDLLHIDGGHRYEDVDHDFKTWLPKLKKNGIILFHDVYSHIDDGSCNHWQMILKNYQYRFDFMHSCGLGILFPKGEYWYKELESSGFFKYHKDLYYYRSKFKYTNERFKELKKLYEERYKAIEKQTKLIDERDKTIQFQTKLLDDNNKTIQSQTKLIDERDETIQSQTKLIDERDETIQSQTKLIDERDETIQSQTKLIDERDETIQSQTKLIDERDETIQSQTKLINEKDKTIQSQTKLIDEKDKTIQSQTKLIDERDETIQSQTKLIDERDELIINQKNTISEYLDIINGHIFSRRAFKKIYGGK